MKLPCRHSSINVKGYGLNFVSGILNSRGFSALRSPFFTSYHILIFLLIPVLRYAVSVCIHLISSEVHFPAGTGYVDGHPREPWPPENSCTSLDSSAHSV